MLWKAKQFALLSCICSFSIFVAILLIMSATDIFMGSSDSADRLIKYLVMGQSGSAVLLGLCLAWVKESGVLEILFP